MYTALIGIILALVVIFLLFKRSNLFQGGIITKSSEDQLRSQCRELLKMPPEEADKVIDRLIEKEKEKNPGQTEEWYLDKVLFDLEKDKQR